MSEEGIARRVLPAAVLILLLSVSAAVEAQGALLTRSERALAVLEAVEWGEPVNEREFARLERDLPRLWRDVNRQLARTPDDDRLIITAVGLGRFADLLMEPDDDLEADTRYEQDLARIRGVITRQPTNARAHYLHAWLQTRQGPAGLGIVRDPEGDWWTRVEDSEQAIAAARQAVVLEPTRPAYTSLLLTLLLIHGQFVEADQRISGLDPSHPLHAILAPLDALSPPPGGELWPAFAAFWATQLVVYAGMSGRADVSFPGLRARAFVYGIGIDSLTAKLRLQLADSAAFADEVLPEESGDGVHRRVDGFELSGSRLVRTDGEDPAAIPPLMITLMEIRVDNASQRPPLPPRIARALSLSPTDRYTVLLAFSGTALD